VFSRSIRRITSTMVRRWAARERQSVAVSGVTASRCGSIKGIGIKIAIGETILDQNFWLNVILKSQTWPTEPLGDNTSPLCFNSLFAWLRLVPFGPQSSHLTKSHIWLSFVLPTTYVQLTSIVPETRNPTRP